MTITLELAPELERQLQQAAAQAGLSPDVYIVETLRGHLLPAPRQQVDVQRLSSAESELLLAINHSLDGIAWARYHALVAKRQAETLTAEEQHELIELSDRIEAANAQRMSQLVELSRLRAIPLTALIQELGLKPSPNG
ncbi:MAG TPA: hypothetical protein VEZ12_17070 [Herpetosiphonaceae bacterium]|jgi:hypothetical protein|nr:hypothetical protein [Herpetosiphonaceae bacterium]